MKKMEKGEDREIGERKEENVKKKVVKLGKGRRAHLRVFCTSSPATTAIVVGREAAHTPSRFNVFSSIPDATTRGGHTDGEERRGEERKGEGGDMSTS